MLLNIKVTLKVELDALSGRGSDDPDTVHVVGVVVGVVGGGELATGHTTAQLQTAPTGHSDLRPGGPETLGIACTVGDEGDGDLQGKSGFTY